MIFRNEESQFYTRNKLSFRQRWPIFERFYEPTAIPDIGRVIPGIMKDSYFAAGQPAPAPHHVHPEGCAAQRIVLVTVPRVSRACEHFSDGFDFRLLRMS